MAALPFRSLVGHNIRTTLHVDYACVQDIIKTKSIFEFLCPFDMKVVAVNKCFGNGKHQCNWEVLYAYRLEAQKDFTPENAKNAYQEILKFLPVDVSVKERDKQILNCL